MANCVQIENTGPIESNHITGKLNLEPPPESRVPTENKYLEKTNEATVTINSDTEVKNLNNGAVVKIEENPAIAKKIEQEAIKRFSSLTVTPPFVLKLCSMLATDEFHDLITWGEGNDTVLVKDLGEFSRVVLPKYFKHKNFTSFLRQLNMYGFYTLRQGNNWREFKNELFKRDRSADYDKIKRKTTQSSTNGVRNTKESRRVPLSNSSSENKESRKRKKDVFKGKNVNKSNNSRNNLIEYQRDLIKQLLRRCEANEERIERLEEKLGELGNFVKQIREEKLSCGNQATASQESTTSDVNNPRASNHIPDTPGFEFGPEFYNTIKEFEHPMGSRQRTLSDTFVSIGPQFSQGNQTFGSVFDGLGQGVPSFPTERLPSYKPVWRKSSVDEMSISMLNSNYGHTARFDKSKNDGPRRKAPKKSKKKANLKQNSSTLGRVKKKSEKLKPKKKAQKLNSTFSGLNLS